MVAWWLRAPEFFRTPAETFHDEAVVPPVATSLPLPGTGGHAA